MQEHPAAPRRKVLWLPAPPTAGAMSMDRHWRELDHARLAHPGRGGWEITCPLGAPPARTQRAGRLRRGWDKYWGYPARARRAVAATRPELVHVLDHSFAHLLRGLPAGSDGRRLRTIVTVHDLAPLRADGGADLTAAQRERFRRTVENVRRADLVLADSRHSADDALRLLGVPAERLRVLPLGVDVARFAGGPAGATEADGPGWLPRLPASRPVVVSVGVAAERKNLALLPAIFRALGSPACCLLRVGDPLPEPLRAELETVLGAEGLVELGRVPEADLAAAYRRADALLFPSRLEGFGFPLLEAMAAGCPAVSSDASSLPEVGGEAALYFAPDDAAGAAGHLRRLFGDEGFRRERVARGRAWAAGFTWERHFARLLALYDEAASLTGRVDPAP